MSKPTTKPGDPPVETPPVAAAPAAPEAPPVETPPATPAPTVEEIAAKEKDFMASWFPAPGPKKPKEEKPVDPPAPAAEKPPEKVEEPPPPAPAPKKEKPLPPPIDEAVKPDSLKATPVPVAAAVKPADGLTDKDRLTLDALAQMESTGNAAKGIVERTKAFWKSEEDYIAKWQKDNQGTAFDPADTQHAEFYEKHEPTYDEEAFDNAKIEVVTERKVAERAAKDDLKRAKEVQERRQRDVEPAIASAVHQSMTELVSEVLYGDEEDEKVRAEKKKAFVLDDKAADDIKKDNPAKLAVLKEESEIMAAQVAEIEKFATLDGYKHNPKLTVKLKSGVKIVPHEMIQDLTVDLEKEIAALPPEQTIRDGKRFSTHADFMREMDKILSSPADDNAKRAAFDKLTGNYYTIDWQDVKNAVIVKHTERAKAKIGAKPAKAAQDPAPKPAAVVEPPIPDFQAPAAPRKAPSVSSASENVDTSKVAPLNSTISEDQFRKSMWG